MKKIALVLAVALSSAACFAQVNKGELKKLQNFLSQPAKEAATNAEALRVTNIKDSRRTRLHFLGSRRCGSRCLTGYPKPREAFGHISQIGRAHV